MKLIIGREVDFTSVGRGPQVPGCFDVRVFVLIDDAVPAIRLAIVSPDTRVRDSDCTPLRNDVGAEAAGVRHFGAGGPAATHAHLIFGSEPTIR